MVSVASQTVKVRDEQEHDMPLLQAISIVFERHPHLKYFFLVPH
jgi:polyamine oxidase